MSRLAEKLSITLPAELAEQVRTRAGRRGVSRYIAEAIAEHLRRETLGAAVAAYERDYGVITGDEVDEAVRSTAQ